MLSARDWVYLATLHLVITTRSQHKKKWTYIRFCCLRAFCFLPMGMYFIVPSVGTLRWPVDRLCFHPWATFTVTHLASSFVRIVSLYGWKSNCSDCPFTARIPKKLYQEFFRLRSLLAFDLTSNPASVQSITCTPITPFRQLPFSNLALRLSSFLAVVVYLSVFIDSAFSLFTALRSCHVVKLSGAVNSDLFRCASLSTTRLSSSS